MTDVSSPDILDHHSEDGSPEQLREVLAGLRKPLKHLPPKYLYDGRGSELFDAITATRDYYPTRTELNILDHHAADIARCVGPRRVVVEFGSGSDVKIRNLLSLLHDPAGYIPIEVSRDALEAAVARLAGDFPRLPLLPIVADFHEDVPLPDVPDAAGVLVFFPGSTIGNLAPDQRHDFLTRARRIAGAGGQLLIGVDLKKDPHVLHRAYNDSDGVNAAFAKNLFARLNREFGGDFAADSFRYYAFYNPPHSRIEMHLVSLKDQTVRVGAQTFRFARGESLLTEYAYKFTPDGFATIAAAAGWDVAQIWTDDRCWFSVQLLTAS